MNNRCAIEVVAQAMIEDLEKRNVAFSGHDWIIEEAELEPIATYVAETLGLTPELWTTPLLENLSKGEEVGSELAFETALAAITSEDALTRVRVFLRGKIREEVDKDLLTPALKDIMNRDLKWEIQKVVEQLADIVEDNFFFVAARVYSSPRGPRGKPPIDWTVEEFIDAWLYLIE